MIAGAVQNIKNYFQRRSIAYSKVFDKQSPFTHDVLVDLAKFCRAHDSSFHPNPHVQATLEGRREVWLRIQNNLNLSLEEIYLLHRAKQLQEKPE
jgi:hypothetical protein